MPKYQVPAGYHLDSGSGLYYKETQMTAPDGRPVRHIYWFNAETGEYIQKNYPLNQGGGVATQKGKTRKAGGKKRHRGLVALSVLTCIVLLALGAGFVVRRMNAPEIITVTPEQVTEAAGVGEPEYNPVFAPYEGSLHLASTEEGTQ